VVKKQLIQQTIEYQGKLIINVIKLKCMELHNQSSIHIHLNKPQTKLLISFIKTLKKMPKIYIFIRELTILHLYVSNQIEMKKKYCAM